MCNAILLISCPDKKGIIAKVSNFIYEHNGNIENSDQHIDNQTNTFFMRIEWALKDFKIEKKNIAQEFRALADEFNMDWNFYFTDRMPRVVLFVSQYLHCLYDLFLRYKAHQFNCEIPLVISNHPHAKKIAANFDIKFLELPITKENKLVQVYS